MTSVITAFRDRIIETFREAFPDLSLDWYDGLFDEQDVNEWIVQAPAAFVSAVSVPNNKAHSTGEMNACLRIIVTVITEDRLIPRENDEQNWAWMEKIAILANQNKFGDPNAGPAETPMMKRLRDPELRREGIALGVVEWDSCLTFGRNRTVEHEFVNDVHTGERIMQVPTRNLFLGDVVAYQKDGPAGTDRADLRRPDAASVYLNEES